ncbi:MAG TPA: ABC transporter permease, partial [Caulobacteraceae bacterium]
MLRNYLAAAIRNLARNGPYAGVTIAGLAIAFAAAILIGLYLRHELTYDQFVPGHDRVFIVTTHATGRDAGGTFENDTTPAELADDLKVRFPQIQYVARITGSGLPPAVRRRDINVAERGFEWADPDFFKVMPVPTIAGDLAHALEPPDGLVLSRSAARKYFGGDAPVGKQLLVDGHPMRVMAVIDDLPTNSHLAGDVFASSKAPFSLINQYGGGGYTNSFVATYVRLKPGASAAEVDAGFPRFVADRIEPEFQRFMPNEQIKVTLRLKPLTAIHLQPGAGDPKPGADVKVLAGIGVIGVLIVLVAAINFVTLMTARATRRAMEVGVRKSVGAGRRDLIVQFIGEALVQVALALILAIALAELLLPGVNTALQRRMSFDYLGDPALLAAMIGVAVVTGLAAGVYPALVLSAFRPASVLKGGPVATAGGGRVRQILVVAQFAVLVTLLVCTFTIYRQTVFALRDATHTNKDNVVMMFADPCTDALRDAVAAVPGVRGAACASPSAVNLSDSRQYVQTDGRRATINWDAVDFGFFELFGERPVAGRFFDPSRPGDDGVNHGPTNPPPVVINASAVRALGFASPQAAVGHQLSWVYLANVDPKNTNELSTQPYARSEIIGVVPDFTFGSVREPVRPAFYYVAPKTGLFTSAALNIKLDPTRIAPTLATVDKVWGRISGGLPVQRYFADQFLLRLYIDEVIQGGFIAVCALIAISVACLGLFALSAYTAERRTKEIGVRKAMGA